MDLLGRIDLQGIANLYIKVVYTSLRLKYA